ncbi:MAG: response regulator [Nitrospinota bacterium]|nr:response regulator [Nitrospinota bacterium]
MEETKDIESLDRKELIQLLRQQDEKLRESQARFDSLARNASAAVFIVSEEGELKCFTDPPKEFPCHGQSRPSSGHISRLIHSGDLPAVMAHFQDIVDGKTTADLGIDCRIAGDDSKWVNARATPIRSKDGALKYVLGLARDISEMKKRDATLKVAMETAESAQRRMEKLSGDISTSIFTFYEDARTNFELIKKQAAMLDTSAAGAVERAQEALSKLGSKISEIKSSPGQEEAPSPPTPVFMDANYLVDVVIKTISGEAAEKGASLQNLVAPQTRIHADPLMIQTILGSLANIAIDMRPGGGKVEFSAPTGQPGAIAIRTTPLPGDWEEDELAERLLPVEEVITRMEGKLTSRAEDGGLAFYVNLPFRRPLALLADDDENLLFLLKTYMDLIGVDVMAATNGKEALEMARTRRPDIVITDYMMPLMDGLELLCALRENPTTMQTPVVIITSIKEAQLREKLFVHGANDLLQKPLTERELIPRIRRFIA